MSPEFQTRLSRLRERVAAGLFLEQLDNLTAECLDLCQDRAVSLALFVLKSVFQDLAVLFENNQPLTSIEFSSLTEGVRGAALVVIEALANDSQPKVDDLERLVTIHLTNVASFKGR